ARASTGPRTVRNQRVCRPARGCARADAGVRLERGAGPSARASERRRNSGGSGFGAPEHHGAAEQHCHLHLRNGHDDAHSGEGNLARFVAPPPPVTGDWQVSAAVPGGAPIPNRLPAPPVPAGNAVSFTYTLIPLTNATQATPAIPFSYFDPKRAAYVDLTIPS